MIKSNSEKPLERVRPFFDRCALMPEYKMLMYVKNKENLLLFDSDVILPLMKMYSKDIGMYENDGENSCMIRFDNGSIDVYKRQDGNRRCYFNSESNRKRCRID